MKRALTVEDMRSRARAILPRILFDFVEGGSDKELTVRANEASFAGIGFRPRMGVHVASPDLSATVLGAKIAVPILLAPCGGISLLHPDGQAGAARAATANGTCAVVGTLAGESLERAKAEGGAAEHWFQLYSLGGRQGAQTLVRRAKAAGYHTLVVTVDTPTVGQKLRDLRHGGIQPGGMPVQRLSVSAVARFAPKVVRHPRWTIRYARSGFPLGQPNLAHLKADGAGMSVEEAYARWMAEPLQWSDLDWIRKLWEGPIAVKGVLSSDDARRAVDAGADGVIVSNHGGRQLDATPATIDALPEVVAAVGSEADVLLDGGVRGGSDVVRAIALGAKAVLIGRPYLYGLAVAGEAGVSSVLAILETELRRTLQLLGCDAAQSLDESWLDPRFGPGAGTRWTDVPPRRDGPATRADVPVSVGTVNSDPEGSHGTSIG